MKNNVIIRLENTLFTTKHISRHLPLAKDRSAYLESALPKCRLNPGFGEFLRFLKACGKSPRVSVITEFRGDPVHKLLAANGMHGVNVVSTSDKAFANAVPKDTVVFSSCPADIMAATERGIPATTDFSDSESIFKAFGVRKIQAKDSLAA